MFEFVKIFFKENRKPSIIFMIIVFFLYICSEPSNNCDLNLKFICNISKLFSHPLIIGVIAFLIWCYCLVQFFRKDYNKDKTDIDDNDEKRLENDIDNWLKVNNIDVTKQYFVKDLLPYYINKDIKEDISKNFFKENEESNDNNFLQQIEQDTIIQKQMQEAKLNTYNNSYLAFCMLIDRCKTIEFKDDGNYDENQKPYCFQKIAEAFGLEWKGRRYLAYIAYSVLGNIGELLEKYNKDDKNGVKIPCVNASVVTKWERDKCNKWCCNGGIKATTWCCYPPYTSKDGEDDREFILQLCEIVKKADNKKISAWKDEYYKLLTEKYSSLKDKTGLDEVYENYKKGEKMTYEKIEEMMKKYDNKENNCLS